MRQADFDAFSAMLDDVAGLYPRGTVTQGQKAMFFRALSAHSIDAVRAGFDAHVKDTTRGRFLPMPADVIAQIEGLAADDGRPGPEEAWAAALRCADENNTIVWTAETAQAWAVAVPVLDGRDQIGARMAFKEAYARLVDDARHARRAPTWTASLGFDAQQRDEVLKVAHAAGRLSAPELLALAAPAIEELAAVAPPGIRERLLALRGRMTKRTEEPSAAALELERTSRLKRDAAARVAAYRGQTA